MLDAKYHVDLNTGFRIRYVKSETEYFRPHCHNYYEIFLALSDNIIHIINSEQQKLSKGNLLFIRDFDVHDYKSGDNNHFEFLNLSFTAETLTAIFNFLGSGIDSKKLLEKNIRRRQCFFLMTHSDFFTSFCRSARSSRSFLRRRRQGRCSPIFF